MFKLTKSWWGYRKPSAEGIGGLFELLIFIAGIPWAPLIVIADIVLYFQRDKGKK